MRRSIWFPVIGFPLLASILVFAYSIYADKTQMLGPLQASLLLAFALNVSIGVGIGFVGSWIKFILTKDSAECVAMFGVKIGTYVFVFLSLISVILALCKQPPTYAAYGTIAIPCFALEIVGCALEPLWLLFELKESISSRRERKRLEKYVLNVLDQDEYERRRRH